jgi:DNA/RNA-binding domain of Phe-tRNA-synthetase-like protein
MPDLGEVLAGASIDPSVLALRPDYRAVLLAVDGLAPSVGGDTEIVLQEAEDAARRWSTEGPVDQQAHVAAWRDAYRAFGAKPQRTRNSLEALLRRAASGLPRVNPLTDLYNALSVLHRVPLGGEDLDRYVGSPRLVRATGDETFETIGDGAPVIEHPDPGEVVWRDVEGVTCRRWNWRQGRRTALRDDTTRALFIFDALAPMTDAALRDAADDLAERLTGLCPGATIARRLLGATEGV